MRPTRDDAIEAIETLLDAVHHYFVSPVYRHEIETLARYIGYPEAGEPVILSHDLEISFFRSPTDTVIDHPSGVTMHHKPTGTVVNVSEHRTRVENQFAAFEALKKQLTQHDG
jgi:protein subunit release factor A